MFSMETFYCISPHRFTSFLKGSVLFRKIVSECANTNEVLMSSAVASFSRMASSSSFKISLNTLLQQNIFSFSAVCLLQLANTPQCGTFCLHSRRCYLSFHDSTNTRQFTLALPYSCHAHVQRLWNSHLAIHVTLFLPIPLWSYDFSFICRMRLYNVQSRSLCTSFAW